MDALIDEIEDILDENAEEFVRGYVQRGGQGWSTFLDPSFFVGAVMASLVAGISWDAFKTAMTNAVHALRETFGHGDDPLSDDGTIDPDFVYMLTETWRRGHALLTGQAPQHSMDEATALHWALFMLELQREAGFVRLKPEQRKYIEVAVRGTPESLTPPQLVARIIDQWIREHPNPNIRF